jgi:hypothetical protein
MKTRTPVAIAMLVPIAAALGDSANMKAIVAHEYGGPEVLKYEDAARPEPKDDQILVRVIAAGVNPVDGMIVSGRGHRRNRRKSRQQDHKIQKRRRDLCISEFKK